MPKTLDNAWKSAVGRDCVDLQTSLAYWLGERLKFLGENTHGHPPKYTFDEWTNTLTTHGKALLNYAAKASEGQSETPDYRDAQNALFFVTRNLGHLWD